MIFMASVKPVADKSDIFRRVRDSGKTLASLGVLSVTLFGSFVRGKQTEQSDVNMLVEVSFPLVGRGNGHSERVFLDLEKVFPEGGCHEN